MKFTITINEKNYTAPIPKFGLLRRLIKMNKALKDVNIMEDDSALDAISEIMVEVFGHQFTVEELENGWELSQLQEKFTELNVWLNDAIGGTVDRKNELTPVNK